MGRRWVIGLSVGFPAALAAAMIWYAWPRSPAVPEPGDTIVAHYPDLLRKGAVILGIYCCGVLLALVVREVRAARSTWLGRALLALAGLVGWAFVCAMSAAVLPVFYFFAFRPWDDRAQLSVPGHGVYHVQHQWETDLLTEEVSRGRLFLKARVLGDAGEYDGALVVRPKGAKQYAFSADGPPFTLGKDDGRLVTSPDGRWILFIYAYSTFPQDVHGCATNLAYSLSARSFCGGQNLPSLSPFVLIRAEDSLLPGDVGALVYVLENNQAYVHVEPDIELLVQDASHPDPRVREVVARMLPHYRYDRPVVLETLTRAAAQDPDLNVRQAAQASLSELNARDPKEAP